jgi:hypothetical protein
MIGIVAVSLGDVLFTKRGRNAFQDDVDARTVSAAHPSNACRKIRGFMHA